MTEGLSDAELRGLLIDCVALWGVEARIAAGAGGVEIATPRGVFLVRRATPEMRPLRWLLQTPDRDVVGRPPRAAPSIVALLSALRSAFGAGAAGRLLIGGPLS
jgi:hypothetical protein